MENNKQHVSSKTRRVGLVKPGLGGEDILCIVVVEAVMWRLDFFKILHLEVFDIYMQYIYTEKFQ